VTPTRMELEIRLRTCAAVGGGKASKGSRCIARNSVRSGTKRDEPQDRQRPENGRRVEEDETVEVARNHEDGARMGTGIPITKGERDAAETRRAAHPGDALPGLNDGGAIFGQPHERKPGLRTGSQGPERVGNGAKVRRVAHTIIYVKVRGPVEGPRRPARGDACEGQGGQR
jgi:hypothetical protein